MSHLLRLSPLLFPSGPAFVNARASHPLRHLRQKASLVSKLSSILQPQGPCLAHARASHPKRNLVEQGINFSCVLKCFVRGRRNLLLETIYLIPQIIFGTQALFKHLVVFRVSACVLLKGFV
jgi:hypothetical protein